MTQVLQGGCACGAVRYELTDLPMFVNCCHCLDCQRQTGSAFVINAIIETSLVVLQKGSVVPITVPTESGRPHDIYRCVDCQIAVWSDYGRRPNLRFVRVGTLDDASALAPDAHIFVRSKLPWVILPENAPRFEIYYDLKTQWPRASLERRSKILPNENLGK